MLIVFTYILIFIKKIMKKYLIIKNRVSYIKIWLKIVYAENKAVKNFLYFMRDGKYL